MAKAYFLPFLPCMLFDNVEWTSAVQHFPFFIMRQASFM